MASFVARGVEFVAAHAPAADGCSLARPPGARMRGRASCTRATDGGGSRAMANDMPRLVRTAERRTDLDFLEGHLNRDTTLLVPLWREQAIVQADGLALATVGVAKDLL